MGDRKRRNRTERATSSKADEKQDEESDTDSKSERTTDALAGAGTAAPMIDGERGDLTSRSDDGLTGDGTVDVESEQSQRTDEQSRTEPDDETRRDSEGDSRMDDENERTDDSADTSFGSSL